MNLARLLLSLPLRWKLLSSLLIVAALIIGLTFFAIEQYARNVQPVGDVLLESLARERSTTLQAVIGTIITNLRNLLDNPTLQDAYALLAAGGDGTRIAQQQLTRAFQNMIDNYPSYWQVRFVTIGGRTLAAVPTQPQVDETEQEYFKSLQRNLTFNGVFTSAIARRGSNFEMDFATIVRRSGRPIGYLVLSVDPTGRNTPAQPSILTALRPFSMPEGIIGFYLIQPDGRIEMISEAAAEQTDERRARAQRLVSQASTEPTSYISPVTDRLVRGFAVPVRGMDRVLVAEVQVLLAARTDEVGRFLVEFSALGFAALGVIALLALYLDWSVARPMRRVSQAAQKALQGRGVPELSIQQTDEIGALASALPALGNRSQQDVQTLESRLARYARQVALTRDIGQMLFNLRDTESLLQQVADLLCQTFAEIDHVHIFSLDVPSQTLLLRVAKAQHGDSPLPRGHRVSVSQRTVIGRAAQIGQAALQLFDESAPNELLSGTRAELALPLRTREGLFGVLDLHSDRAETFGDAEIAFFQAIADQIGVIVTSAQLLEELQARFSEIESLSRRMLGEAWRGYEVARRRTMPRRGFTAPEHDTQWSELQLRAYYSGRLQERIDEETVTFAVPVELRGQRFGAVEWTVPRAAYNENMRLLARELAARLAVSADNARLLEQSQRLAERERLVNTISERLNRQTRVEQVLQVAVRELGQALRLPRASIQLNAQALLDPDQESEERHERKLE